MDIQAATIVAMRILGLISVFKGLMISVNILVSFSVAPPRFRIFTVSALSCFFMLLSALRLYASANQLPVY